MPDEEQGARVYRRETLYREVWAEPVKIVALRYGVSDVALGKTCRKMAIPLPGRGYWAKKKAGKAPPTPALPALLPGIPDVLDIQGALPPRPERKASEETEARMAEEDKEEAAIVVAEELVRPHPLVREAQRLLGRRKQTTSRCLDIHVARDSLDRALRIMDALLKALVARGLTVEVTELRYRDEGPYRHYDRSPDSNATRVLVEGEWVVFGLKEKLKVAKPEPPEPPRNLRGEERDRWVRWNQPSRTYEYNGVLVLFLKNVDYLNVRKEWKDGARKKLEGQLNDFVGHVYLAGEALKEKRLADARAAEAHREWQIKKLEEDRRRWEDEKKAKELLEMLERWRLARDIREFVTEALSLGADPQDRLEWALQHAMSIDPLRKLRGNETGDEEQGSRG